MPRNHRSLDSLRSRQVHSMPSAKRSLKVNSHKGRKRVAFLGLEQVEGYLASSNSRLSSLEQHKQPAVSDALFQRYALLTSGI